MTPELVVFGAGGQFGQALAETPLPDGWRLRALPRAAVDIADADAVAKALTGVESGVVINAAAYTQVDKAEQDPQSAFAINRDGAGHVAAAARRAGLAVVHISTDYVFDGTKTSPYGEDDPVAPLSVYGASKLAGEEAVRAANPRHLILRTSWLFGVHGTNFLRTILRLGSERDQLRVVADQTGCPTAASDLATAVVALAAQPERNYGTFHFCGDAPTTWHGFAAAILAGARARGLKMAELHPIPTADYPLPAARPRYSVLSCAKLTAVTGLRQPAWRQSLEQCLTRLL